MRGTHRKAEGLYGSVALKVSQSARSVDDKVADPLSFIESSWGLDMPLFPVQRIIIKAYYGIALDDNPWGLDLSQPVPEDHPNFREITTLTTPTDPEYGYYKYRIVITDYKRQNPTLFTEAGYLRHLYDEGRSNIREVVPGNAFSEMVLCLGRRSGKTKLSAAIAAYETYKLLRKENPQRYYGLAEGTDIYIMSVATAMEQAKLFFRETKGYFQNCDYFGQYTANSTQTKYQLQTPHDIASSCRFVDDETIAKKSISVTAMPCSGAGIRGRSSILVVLDEIAHFNEDESSDASAADVYGAVKPSIATFSPKDPNNKTVTLAGRKNEGKIISISSPMGKQGFFYEKFQEAMSGTSSSEEMLAIRAPSWEVNPGISASFLQGERDSNPIAFDTEYGAEFTDRTSGWIEDHNDLLKCVDKNLRPSTRAPARRPHFLGLDIGLKQDATAIAIGHIEPGGKIQLDLLDTQQANVGIWEGQTEVDFDAIVDWIYELTKRFSIHSGVFDQYVGIAFEQALKKKGLTQIVSEKFSTQESSDIYNNLKTMMYNGNLILYDWPRESETSHCSYITEMLELQAEIKSKYTISVHAPKLKGKHDDQSDALARMVWLASEHMRDNGDFVVAKGHGSNRIQSAGLTALQMTNQARRQSIVGGTHPMRQRLGVTKRNPLGFNKIYR